MKLLLLFAFGVMSVLTQLSQKLDDFSEGSKQFTSEVYTQLLKDKSGNFLVCPLSVDIILALVRSGAKGETAQQLSSGLHLPNSTKDIQELFKDLTSILKDSKQYKLNTAIRIYLKDGFPILDSFKNTAATDFNAEVQLIDFKFNNQAAFLINAYVAYMTDHKITNVIKSDELKDDTVAVLINALYFQGTWIDQFDKRNTRMLSFYLNSKNEAKTYFLSGLSNYNYYESSELKAKFLELPYLGDDVIMTIVLPNDIEGLSALESHIADVLVAPKYTLTEVKVSFPKFKIETTIEFKPILQALGVKDAFEGSADFSGITDSKVPLMVSKVVQKAFIEVSETGTTAAAATLVEMLAKSAIASGPPKEFTADHPFIFYLKYKSIILFVGRYVGPN